MSSTGTGELRDPNTWRAGASELIATLLFVFIGAGSVVVTQKVQGSPTMDTERLVAIALAHGLAIALLVAATANISGGHINPAVTFGAMLTKKISIPKGAVYIVAQLVGAVIGAALLAAVIPSADRGVLGSHRLEAGVSPGAGLLAEVVLTFVLVFTVFATAMDPKGLAGLAPVAIGLAVLVDHLVGVPLTGASMNPARSFGPALVSGTWDTHWLFWVGPAIGGGLAAIAYQVLFMGRRAKEA
ncbi:MAG: MIP family channel protein [Chloroflexi bacterium]|nr:MIP family channel protein [Chloroflexota bacterium]